MPLVFSTGFAVLEAGPCVDSRYLHYLCRSEWFVGEVTARSVGVSYPAISSAEIGKIRVSVPELEEQRRVADFLDVETARMDRIEAAQLRVKSLLHERRSTVVTECVRGAHYIERRPSDVPWLQDLPADWRSGKISFVARMGSGHTPSRSHPEWWIDCVIPWITTGEVAQIRDDRQEVLTETRESISYIGMANSSAEIHPAGTVVLSRTASAGFSAVMGRDMATSQDFVTWTCGPLLDPYYLLWCLRAMRPDLLGRLAYGSTHKTIYVPDLQALRIPLPPLPEQREIVARIRKSNRSIDKLVDKIDRWVNLLAERKRALITAAVTGQIDVTTARGVEV
jgi:type I restriction enzyme S subunit